MPDTAQPGAIRTEIDGRSLVAALSRRADGMNMGTGFMASACRESLTYTFLRGYTS